MSLSTILVIVFDSIALLFAAAAFVNLMDSKELPESMKPEDIQLGIFRMVKACAELLMALFLATGVVALAGLLAR